MADKSSDGARVVATVAILFAILGSMAGVMRPMANQIKALQDSLAESKREVNVQLAKLVERMEHDDERERTDAAELAHLAAEATAEQEGISRLGHDFARLRAWADDHDLRVRGLNTSQWTWLKFHDRSIMQLWEATFNGATMPPIPNVSQPGTAHGEPG